MGLPLRPLTRDLQPSCGATSAQTEHLLSEIPGRQGKRGSLYGIFMPETIPSAKENNSEPEFSKAVHLLRISCRTTAGPSLRNNVFTGY